MHLALSYRGKYHSEVSSVFLLCEENIIKHVMACTLAISHLAVLVTYPSQLCFNSVELFCVVSIVVTSSDEVTFLTHFRKDGISPKRLFVESRN